MSQLRGEFTVENQVARTVTRRAVLGGAAALGTAAFTRPAAASSVTPKVPVTGTAKVGATFNLYPFHGTSGPGTVTQWKSAISSWNAKTGTTKSCGKVYFTQGEIPTSVEPQLQAFIHLGIQALISIKPAIGTTEGGTSADKTALANAMRMFSRAGLDAEVCLWNEVGPHDMTAAKYHQYVRYYGPVIREYYPLVFDVESYLGPSQWRAYDPTHAYLDGYAIDYYCNDHKNGITLDELLTLAGDLPVGVWEMGNTANPGFTPTPKEVNAYMAYIQSTLASRLAKGLPVGSSAWYNGPADASQGLGNEIVGQHPCALSALDITDYDALWKAVNGKSPA